MKLTGAIPSPPDERDRDFAFHKTEKFAGAFTGTRTSVDVTDLHTWRVQPANSCVEYAIAEQCQALGVAEGRPLDLLGVARFYALTRLRTEAPVPSAGIPDTGSSQRYAYAVAREDGIQSEDVWPDSSSIATLVPPARVWEAAPLIKLGTCHRIFGEGDVDALRDGIITALTLARDGKCSPPTTLMQVDDAYGALPEDEVYSAPGGNVWGWHCQMALAYLADLDAVALASSWSKRRFLVSVPWLAANGGETWVVDSILRQGSLL